MKKTIIFAAGILALCMAMYGCDSSTGNTRIDLTAPPVPTNVVFSEIGNGAVTLTWNAVSDGGLRGYYVYWQSGTAIDSMTADRVLVMSSTATITGLDYETEYSFAVSSVDLYGNESRFSPIRTGTPYNTEPPLPPEGLDVVATNIESSRITVRWSANTEPDMAKYELYRSPSASGFTSDLSPLATVTAATSYIDTTAEVGVRYYYRLKAVDRGGKKSSSSATVNDVILSRPVLVSPINYEDAGLRPVFSWQAVPGAKKYRIIVSASLIASGNDILWVADVDSTKIQLTYAGSTALISGKYYYWKIGTISNEEINSVSSGVFRAQK